MIVALKALAEQAERIAPPSGGLSGQAVAELVQLLDYVNRELVDPAFARFEGEGLEEAWTTFDTWAQPAVNALIDRLIVSLAQNPAVSETARRADRDFPELTSFLDGLSPGLGRAFQGALKVGFKSDLILLDNVDRLQPGPSLARQQLHLRLRGAMHFGLTFLLLDTMRRRSVADPRRGVFFVEILKKTASASLMNTFRIVKWISDGCSETMEK